MKKTLTVAELKSLLLARFNADKMRQAKLQARFQQELGMVVQEEKPESIAIENMCADWISDVLARRLKRNRHTTPLLSSKDFDKFVPSMVNEVMRIEGREFEAEDSKFLEKFMKAILESMNEAVYSNIPSRKNPYEEYWRWIKTVLDLATERDIEPIELLALENETDEIVRRMFTKRQYIANSKKMMKKFVDADVFKKILIQPLLEMLSEGDEEELRELTQEIEAELMPELRETVNNYKTVINVWLGEEVERIYAKA